MRTTMILCVLSTCFGCAGSDDAYLPEWNENTKPEVTVNINGFLSEMRDSNPHSLFEIVNQLSKISLQSAQSVERIAYELDQRSILECSSNTECYLK